MLYILHGDDTISSRKRLEELATGFASPIYLQADKTNFSEIVQALSSTDMFQSDKCVVIENISKLPKSDLEKIRGVFEKVSKEKQTLLILWQGSEMTKVSLGKFKGATSETFMLPKLFFSFLDGFTRSGMVQEIELLQKMTNVDEMQIFYALIKRVRQLLMIKSGGEFEELSKMSPWQKEKLFKQSRMWTENDLKDVFEKLFEIEKNIKTSMLSVPLKKQLDILLTFRVN